MLQISIGKDESWMEILLSILIAIIQSLFREIPWPQLPRHHSRLRQEVRTTARVQSRLPRRWVQAWTSVEVSYLDRPCSWVAGSPQGRTQQVVRANLRGDPCRLFEDEQKVQTGREPPGSRKDAAPKRCRIQFQENLRRSAPQYPRNILIFESIQTANQILFLLLLHLHCCLHFLFLLFPPPTSAPCSSSTSSLTPHGILRCKCFYLRLEMNSCKPLNKEFLTILFRYYCSLHPLS